MQQDPFDAFIMREMPHYVAFNYQKLLEAQQPRERVKCVQYLFNLMLRTLTITLVSQYLLHDPKAVRDPRLNDLLLLQFPHLTPDTWNKIFFASLRAYEGKRHLLFVPELYDFYWNTAVVPHAPRPEAEQPFNRLTQSVYDLASEGLSPRDEAGWGSLAQELTALIRDLLGSLTFLSHYDLIRVTDYDEQTYIFQLHKGTAVSSGRAPLPTGAALNRDWFYLRSEDGSLFLLHPLLVSWDTAASGKISTEASDVGLYDRQVYEQLQYVLAQSGIMALDASSGLQAFISLIYNTIEEVKLHRREAQQLTWPGLQDLCSDITTARMASVSKKYDPALYLQRQKTRGEFEKFLASDKRCFVLIGKSGVGKSSFLLALNEELKSSGNDICALMYDGAQIQSDRPLRDVISQDFDDRLMLAGRNVEDIWREIARIGDIQERTVLLCVDAVNENRQASELLWQLDQLAQQPWPWLKIVFSSRPETWQSIKRGVRLSEALYYQENGEALGVSLEPFVYSQQIDLFTRIELAQAYAKYRERFHMQTDYDELSLDLKEVLREPLNLRLVAAAHQHALIPSTLRVSDLIGQYVRAMMSTGRLSAADLHLLERRLVPLMASPGRFSNDITAEQLDAAGGGLYEAVYSDQKLSDGRQLNASFNSLVDADILIRQETRRAERIAFKYERFYEHFVGNRIFELSAAEIDRYAFFVQMAGMTATSPYLWGAVRNALASDAVEHGTETLLELSYTEHQRIKELMVDTLTSMGADERQRVEAVLGQLIPPQRKKGRMLRVRQLMAPSDQTDVRSRNAGKIAVEVASNVNLPQVLESAAVHPDSTIRTAAVRSTYLLWSRDMVSGFDVLAHIAEMATPGMVPDSQALESSIGLSFAIFFDHLHDADVLKRLQTIWRGALGRLLGVQEAGNQASKWLRDVVRQRIYQIAVALAFRLLRDIGESSPVNAARLEAFFHLPAEQKKLYRRLVGYLDGEGAYTREEMERDVLAALPIRNLLVETTVGMVLAAHLARDPEGFLPFVKQLFAEAERDPIPSAWRTDITFAVMAVVERDPLRDELFDFFIHAIESCHEYYADPEHSLARFESDAADCMYLAPYIAYQYQRAGTVQTPWLVAQVESAFRRHSSAFFKSFLLNHLGQVGIEKRKPQAALDALALVWHSDDADIKAMAATFLARLRIHYSDDVDAFLDEQQAPEAYRLKVRTSEPSETVGELIGFRIYNFLLGDVIMGSPDLRAQFMGILIRAVDCKNLREWVNIIIPEVVNRVYGGQVL